MVSKEKGVEEKNEIYKARKFLQRPNFEYK